MKVLILSASVGSGHMRAAQALRRAFALAYPKVKVDLVDVLELANAPFRTVYGDGYLGLANFAPHLLGFLYDAVDRPAAEQPLSESMRRLLQRWSIRGLPRLLKDSGCDIVVNTHFLPAELHSRLKEAGKSSLPQATVVTDFEAHRLWAQTPTEKFFAASEDAASALRHWGVAKDSISITGIPIDPEFCVVDRNAALALHGLSGRRPIVLQLAGGSGLGPIEEIFDALIEVQTPTDLVVVTGRNSAARQKLVDKLNPTRHRVRILGFTERMHELMSIADLAVTKPGGLTTSEALACGVPLVAINPIPGQESRNCDYILENGAGVKANSINALPRKVGALLDDAERLSSMRRKALELGTPRAAFNIAQQVYELAQRHREKLQEEPVISALKRWPSSAPVFVRF